MCNSKKTTQLLSASWPDDDELNYEITKYLKTRSIATKQASLDDREREKHGIYVHCSVDCVDGGFGKRAGLARKKNFVDLRKRENMEQIDITSTHFTHMFSFEWIIRQICRFLTSRVSDS